MKFVLVGILLSLAPQGFAKRVICYYVNWSAYRPDPFKIELINPELCSHLVYEVVGLDENGSLKLIDPWNDVGDEWHEGGFQKFQKLRVKNPSVKLILSVGGWNEGPTKFQSMVRSPEKRKNFLNSSLSLLRKYKFDGLEINWVFHDSQGGTPEDKNGYSELVKEMKPAYEKNGLILTAATSAIKTVFLNSYDIAILSKYLDFVNIKSYDLHGSWDNKAGHVSPLRPLSKETGEERYHNVEAIVDMYLGKGAIPEKLNVGTVGYGRTFTLLDPKRNEINNPTIGPGKVEEPMPFNKFCKLDRSNFWKKFRNAEQVVPYAVNGDQWVGYEDSESLIAKAKLSKLKKLGGITFFSLDQDDHKGECGLGKYPLLKALKEEIEK